MNLCVGLDIKFKAMDVVMLSDESDVPTFSTSVDNDLGGANTIKNIILELAQKNQFEKIIVGLLSTAVYGFEPMGLFNEDVELNHQNLSAVVVNPQSLKQYKESMDISPSPRQDAFCIADILRTDRYLISFIDEEKYKALQQLTRSRHELMHTLAKAKIHFLLNLYNKVNNLSTRETISDFEPTNIDSLANELTIDGVVNSSSIDLIEFLNQKSQSDFAQPADITSAILNAERYSNQLDQVSQSSVDLSLAMYINKAHAYQAAIENLDESIKQLLVTIPDSKILQSIPGIGPSYAAGILAEIGHIERFNNQAQLAKYAGVTWQQPHSNWLESSRKSRAVYGNEYLRYYLTEAVASIIKHDETFKKYFMNKMDKVKNLPQNQVLLVTARKLVKVIDALLRNQVTYKV